MSAGTSRPTFNTKSPTIKRILQESRELSLSPDPTLTASPLESNLFEWHFTLTGPPSSPYEKGIYHGRIVLPPTYPLRPPMFRFLTPSGRFEVNREICLSISGHHEETWQPAWGIRTALCAIRAFMSGDAKGQVGGLDMGWAQREKLALESRGWKCAGCGGRSNEEVIREVEEEWRESGAGERKEEVVPEELRLAFREDLDREKEEERQEKGGDKVGETVGVDGADRPIASERLGKAAASPRKTPSGSSDSVQVTSHSQTTSSTSPQPHPVSERVGAARQRVTMQATSGHNVTPPDATPPWLDKAIVGIVIALIIMVLKKFAASEDY
ncbi:MAG: hypothetical protein MMC23_003518 [Stictis urceolatum]|nr:hypothetical protein [Stictis urceolata]